MFIKSVVPENTCCDMRDSWNVISKLSSDFGVIVHGPGGCENEFSFSNKENSTYSFSTNLNEVDITLGTGYEKLRDKIEYIIKEYTEIKVLFILGTCSSELIGDDIDNVKNEFKDSKIKIFVFHTSGMRGSGYHYTKYNIFKELFNIFSYNENEISENSINIFFQDGMQNDDFKKELINNLNIFGIKINSFFNSNISFLEIENLLKSKKNYLIGKDQDFIEILSFVNKNFKIPFKILELPIGTTLTNKFYSGIYFDFFSDKTKFVIDILKIKKNILNKVNFNLLKKYYKDLDFITNSKEYSNILNDFDFKFIYNKELGFIKNKKNTSHKFNYSNKILIKNKNLDINKIIENNSFSTINRYMGFNGLLNFNEDLLNQYHNINFINKYSKYI